MEDTKSVFLSYSSKDDYMVEKITGMLHKMGILYWKAPEMIPTGSSYAREIPKAIQTCEVFLLLLSENSQKSIWVEKEVDTAISFEKKIIPFRIDECQMNDTFKFYLNNVQMISFLPNKQDAVNQLKNLLASDLLSEEKRKEKGMTLPQSKYGSLPVTFDEDATITPIVWDNQKKVSPVADNKAPKFCPYCSGELENVSVGTFRCKRCGRISYDDFQKVRNYLNEHGPTSAIVIEQETGVSRRIVDSFFRQEYLEFPALSSARVHCKKCGAPIRTGVYCDSCKKIQTNEPAERWRSSRKKN